MRKFSSYGPIDTHLHYYAPRQALIDAAVHHLTGEDPNRGGHYITVWAPRQRGKSWLLNQAVWQLREQPTYAGFDALKINLEHLKMTPDVVRIARFIADTIGEKLVLTPVVIQQLDDLYAVFRKDVLPKPLILILDEFDALAPEAISGLVSVFRNIYNTRREQANKLTAEKDYLLHGMALIGVRSVLGLDNPRGSPFNSSLLPNANVINIISKANEEPHRTFLIELFQTEPRFRS